MFERDNDNLIELIVERRTKLTYYAHNYRKLISDRTQAAIFATNYL